MVEAVIFDLDGVLIESEHIWDDVRRQLTIDQGGRWALDAQVAMMGMSSIEWSAFMHDELGVALEPGDIVDAVVDAMAARYQDELPLKPGAQETVRRLASRYPLGLASSSNRPLIDLVLRESGLAACFAETLSTEEVARGKPAPDVYLEVTRRMGVDPTRCAGVEDSTNGIRALKAARLRAIAIPNSQYPPDPAVLASADAVLADLEELTRIL